MSFGIEVHAATGGVSLDTSKTTFSVADVIQTEVGISGSRSYVDLTGWQVVPVVVQDAQTGTSYGDLYNFTKVNVYVSYTNGYPQVSWDYSGSTGTAQPVRIFVMAN
jgi:hypothetical protein